MKRCSIPLGEDKRMCCSFTGLYQFYRTIFSDILSDGGILSNIWLLVTINIQLCIPCLRQATSLWEVMITKCNKFFTIA